MMDANPNNVNNYVLCLLEKKTDVMFPNQTWRKTSL